MWETLILAVVCVVLLTMLYAVSGAWKTHPGVKGFFRWTAAQLRLRAARPGAPTNPAFLAGPARFGNSGGEKPSDARLAIQVLEEMYQEWDQRSRQLEARIQAVETAVARLTAMVEGAMRDARNDTDEVSAKGLRPKPSDSGPVIGMTPKAAAHAALENNARELEVPSSMEAADTSKHGSQSPWPRAQASRELLYFSILDLLHEGRSRDEIQDLLGVSTDEIAVVEKLLRMAGRSESGVH